MKMVSSLTRIYGCRGKQVWMLAVFVFVHFHLEAVVEEEQRDIFAAITWLLSQSDRLYAVNQAAMGGQQVGLQRESTKEQGGE